MANLRTAMDAAFWDLKISTTQSLDGTAKSVPGEPIPLDGARASRVLRIQQLSLLGNGFPLGIIPSYSPPSQKELGSFCLQSLLLKASNPYGWAGLVTQFRPKKLISGIKEEVSSADEWELPAFKDVAKHFLDKSLYSIGMFAQLALASSSSFFWSTERDGEKKARHTKAMFYHQLSGHDITLEAAWPELFIDHKKTYWNVPRSIYLDCSSVVSETGLRYRFGIHKNDGQPQSINSDDNNAPLALRPGICVNAACSYEKSKDIWREKERKEDVIIETEKGKFWRPAYDIRLREPHAAISGIIGARCAAWFGKKCLVAAETTEEGNTISQDIKGRNPINADIFGSVCYTFQHGKFRKLFGDLSRIDVRMDICSGLALAKEVPKMFRKSSVRNAETQLSSPRLSLILQQQVAGPIVFRVDSRFLLNSSRGGMAELEDLMLSLNYSLRLLHSGKVVAWFSPKRGEGMIELRLFEF